MLCPGERIYPKRSALSESKVASDFVISWKVLCWGGVGHLRGAIISPVQGNFEIPEGFSTRKFCRRDRMRMLYIRHIKPARFRQTCAERFPDSRLGRRFATGLRNSMSIA